MLSPIMQSKTWIYSCTLPEEVVRNVIRVILYYPGICYPMHLGNSTSSDSRLQELGLDLHFGNVLLQLQSQDCSILSAAWSHLSSMPLVRSLYKTATKAQLTKTVISDCETHLNHLSVQCKFLDSARLKTSCRIWNKLLSGFHPGHSFPFCWGLPWTHFPLQSTYVLAHTE